MKKVFILVILFSNIVTLAQSKKERIITLENRIDSFRLALSNETQTKLSNEKRDALKIIDLNNEISARNIEIKDLKTKVQELNTQLVKHQTEIAGLKKQLSLVSDSVDNLKYQIEESNRLMAIANLRNSREFEIFLNHFLLTTYSKKNIDSLIYVSSPLIQNFISEEFGFGRFWNIGAACNLYDSDKFGYHFYDGYFGETEPEISNLSYFANQYPEGGFCIEATSPNGIYYKQVTDLPTDWDMMTGKAIPPPLMLNPLKKMAVNVQHNFGIVKTFYFIESNNKWFLLYIDDCDCSA
jgi:uncharacterized coiled-coil protein SlyX